MKRALIAIAAGLLLLTACGGQPDAANTPAAAAPSTVAASAEDPSGSMTQFSPRGAKIGKVGGPEAAIEARGGGFALDFTVDDITVDAPCTPRYEYGQPPAVLVNGHRIAVAITVHTRPGYNRSALSIDPFAEQNFHYAAPDGTVTQSLYNSATTSCKVTELPSTLLPGSTYKGTVMLDVPATSGTLVLDANGGAQVGTNNTFEWTF